MIRATALADPGPLYDGYVYAYPHKTAYRPLPQPLELREVWAREPGRNLFLYIHLPFCPARCGYCNLFCITGGHDDLVEPYLDALRRQARRTREVLVDATFTRFAIGGGTPTLLSPGQLDELFELALNIFGVDPGRVETSVETSPATASPEKLALLRARGVQRLSIGVQSFVEAECRAIGRQQAPAQAHAALSAIRQAGVPILNLDLIYGLPGQTLQSWQYSLESALAYAPEEIYLYPLYVRPQTGLAQTPGPGSPDQRPAFYFHGRDFLLAAGYVQTSMRHFLRSAPDASLLPSFDGSYCCQKDGMIGLGCGARSYTRQLHYSFDYAVGPEASRQILKSYLARPAASFGLVDFGFAMDAEEQRRRFVLKSLLKVPGLSETGYQSVFGTASLDDLPELGELREHGWTEHEGGCVRLTPEGLALSDRIGPRLYSARVRRLMEAYHWR